MPQNLDAKSVPFQAASRIESISSAAPHLISLLDAQVVALQSRSVDKLVVDHLDIGIKMISGVSWSQLKLW